MPATEQHHALVAQPTPLVSYPQRPELLHWDGGFFALLCLVSWIWFACLWGRRHLSKPPRRPPPLPELKVENFMGSDHWRN
jgi:hypothetical protein